jgi:hypothetical protein
MDKHSQDRDLELSFGFHALYSPCDEGDKELTNKNKCVKGDEENCTKLRHHVFAYIDWREGCHATDRKT